MSWEVRTFFSVTAGGKKNILTKQDSLQFIATLSTKSGEGERQGRLCLHGLDWE